MNVRRILPLLVIASMMLSILPSVMFANSALTFTAFYLVTDGVEGGAVTTGVKGNVIAAKGTGLAAGTLVQVYWDDVTITPYNGVKGFLNQTTVKSDGSWDLWFIVPEAVNGVHNVWFKDFAANSQGPNPFTVNTKIKLSSTSGQAGDAIATNYYGFSKTKDLRIAFASLAFASWPVTAVANATELIATGNGVATEFTGNLAHANIKPTTMSAYAGAVTIGPDAAGAIGTGTINYVTGAYDIIFSVAPIVGKPIYVAYSWFNPALVNAPIFLDSSITNSIGSATSTETVPTSAPAVYSIIAFDAKGVNGAAAFTIGPVITVTPAASTSGAIVHILGRGYTPAATITSANIVLTETTAGMIPANCYIYNPTGGTITVDASGRFTGDIVVPQGNKVKDDYTLTVTSSAANSATADFQITALASVTANPQFGAQGTSVVVSGTNFEKIAGTTVSVDLTTTGGVLVVNMGTVKTLADGSFSKTFTVPAQVSAGYKIKASIATMNIQASTSFTIGNLLLILSKSSAPVGATITVSGAGFTAGQGYNITLGTKKLVTLDTVAVGGVITKVVTIPKMTAGTYTLTVYDKFSGIPVSAQFTVTYDTMITVAPSTIPSGFNVSVTGKGFGYAATSINYIVYNKTAAGVIYSIWTMNVYHGPAAGLVPAAVNTTGFALGWWNFNKQTTAIKLDNGVYNVNATDNLGFKATTTFTVGSKHIVATPRKATFLIGETISFNLEHSFGNVAPILNSKLKIYNPAGALVLSGDPLATWTKVGDWYSAPFSSQTAGGNPMVLPDDAPTGSWSWKWTDLSDPAVTVGSGTFTVAAAATSALSKQVEDLAKQVTALQSSLAGITTAVTSAQTEATKAGTTAQAAVTAATAASTAATAASTAATAASAAANAASTAANAASKAASDASTTAGDLKVLVYGAIGASIVAALAAIVGLMTVSRKIA